MAIEIISQNDGSRINHKVYGDVYNVTYAKAVITEFETVETEKTRIMRLTGPPAEVLTWPFVDWEFTDRVKLDAYGDEWVPLFYHCKLHCYDDDVASLRDNGALTGSAYAFQIGDEVKVLLEENVPKYVIGHFDGKVRMGTQYFKLSFTDNDHFAYSNHKIEEDSIKVIPTDHYGDEPNCDQLGEMMSWAFWYGNDDYYQYLDYYVKVGPVLYVFWIGTITYFDGAEFRSVRAEWRVFSGVWSEELLTKCKAVFNTHISLSPGQGFPAGWSELPIYQITSSPSYDHPGSYPYPPEMKEQYYYSWWRYDDLGIPRQAILGIFSPVGRYIYEMPLYFDKVKFEGQSYYEE